MKAWNRMGLRALSCFALAMIQCHAAAADFEVSGPGGRRILLKDDGTWRYVEPGSAEVAKDGAAGEAVLQLDGRTERGNACRFAITLTNDLPYEIASFVPSFTAYRRDGVAYDTVSISASFNTMKPGNRQSREFEFYGIKCEDIARVQVVGGDRCVMGDLHRFSDATGQCLARIKVAPSNVVRFDK